jgi:hypothetical protein
VASFAERHGWQIIAEFSDKGISGAKGRKQGPGFDKLLQAVARLATVQSLRRKGIGIGKIARTLGIGASYVQRVVAETEPR